MKHLLILILTALLLMVVACTTEEDDSSPLPTQEFSPIENPDQPTPEPQASPTDSAVVDATPAPTSTRGLPPTWTPTAIPATPTFAPTLDSGATWMAATPAPPATVNPGCLTFNLDPARTISVFTVGQSPTLSWTAATGASLYRVYVYDESGLNTLHQELLAGTSLVVNPDVFPRPGVYVWTVAPLDAFGIQMCIELGDGVIAERQR